MFLSLKVFGSHIPVCYVQVPRTTLKRGQSQKNGGSAARCALPVKRGGAPIELGKLRGFGRRKLGGFFFGANGTCPEKNPHRAAAAAAAVGGLPPPKKSLGVNTKWVIFLNTFFIFNDPGLPFKNLHGIDCEPRVKAWLKP